MIKTHGNTGKRNAAKDSGKADEFIHIRCTADQKEKIVLAAQAVGKTISKYLLSICEGIDG